MAKVDVNVATVAIASVPLSAKVLSQIPYVDYDAIKHLCKEGHPQEGEPGVIGWIAEAAFPKSHQHRFGPRLLVSFGNGSYGLFCALPATTRKFKQLYIV